MCTIFVSNGLVGKNHDNFVQNGMVFTNLRGKTKRSLALMGEKALAWRSEYGSVTFSQCGKGMPVGGMNECGLIVEQATLPETLYPEADERPEISCLEAIQYILDTCKSTVEAVNSFPKFRISRNSWTMHYLLCDADGKAAIVEFINGVIQIHDIANHPLPVLTNTAYEQAAKGLYDRGRLNDYQINSVERFATIKEELLNTTLSSENGIFTVLEKASREDTVWRCVYDSEGRKMSFRTIFNKEVSEIDLTQVDFSPAGTPLLYDIESKPSTFLFAPYSREMNRKNIANFFGNPVIVSMMNLPNSDFIIGAFDSHIDGMERETL